MLHHFATWSDYRRRITRDHRIMSGEPCIAGTRMPTRIVHDYFGSNWPGLHLLPYWRQNYGDHYSLEDLRAAIWYENLPHRRLGRWWAERGFSIVRNRDE